MLGDGWSPVQRVGPNLRARHGWHPAAVAVVAPVWTPGSLRPVCLDDVFDGPPADRAARIDLSLQLEPAVVAQTHVAAGVDDGVHLLVEANGAFSVLSSREQLRAGDGWGDGRTEGGAGSRHCEIKDHKDISEIGSEDGFHGFAAVKKKSFFCVKTGQSLIWIYSNVSIHTLGCNLYLFVIIISCNSFSWCSKETRPKKERYGFFFKCISSSTWINSGSIVAYLWGVVQ